MGGWGASPGHDGNGAIFSGFHGETFNCPAEIAEARYGLDVLRLALNPTPGGEGKWRGGKGIRLEYRARSDNNFLTDRWLFRARASCPGAWREEWGWHGELCRGRIRTSGEVSRHRLCDRHRAQQRRRGRRQDQHGERRKKRATARRPSLDPAAIEADLLNRYVTPEEAREIYGYEGH